MSRSGYTDYDDDGTQWDFIRWRGQVASALRGKRGQAFLRELLAALEAMPEKRLVSGHLRTIDGEVCALGALGRVRGIDLEVLDPEDYDSVARTFSVAHQIIRELSFENDERTWFFVGSVQQPITTPEHRWKYMHDWVEHWLQPAEEV